jgi:hypothetical protein
MSPEEELLMRVRTVYFKVDRLAEVVAWWESFLGEKPTKRSDDWVEFRVGDVNLAFLPDEADASSGCILVLAGDDAADKITEAKRLGAKALEEDDDSEGSSDVTAVLVDPFGHEFEVTNYKD